MSLYDVFGVDAVTQILYDVFGVDVVTQIFLCFVPCMGYIFFVLYIENLGRNLSVSIYQVAYEHTCWSVPIAAPAAAVSFGYSIFTVQYFWKSWQELFLFIKGFLLYNILVAAAAASCQIH